MSSSVFISEPVLRAMIDRELQLLRKENELLRREKEIALQELEFLKLSRDNQSSVQIADGNISIELVGKFLPNFDGSSDASFWQNCRIWSEENPHKTLETPLHPQKLTVWCVLWAGGVIGPYFFRNNVGEAVTVNGDRYRAMITDYFVPELDGMNVDELWFQQDGATCHTAHVTIDLLKETFNECIISRNGPVNWPPRSCDLTPLDYFLWGYVKSLVYANKPETLGELEANIRGVIADIRPHMLEKVVESWTSRIGFIRASRGGHMPEIIFKH
ncbi:uncharacterized protein [Musca autumnalis]|uniref:uncharacterized protein n=1 Tax=Musca autumnalis TaxID=221902 RepID=UPI003CF725AB